MQPVSYISLSPKIASNHIISLGQKKPVHVYRLVAEDTVESQVIEIQERKRKLVQEAFKGIKNAETQRQQREARLKGLLEPSSQ
jgi:SWI/SNF-related matrix-associated actin-dependent regulator of chromatin subfamily A3